MSNRKQDKKFWPEVVFCLLLLASSIFSVLIHYFSALLGGMIGFQEICLGLGWQGCDKTALIDQVIKYSLYGLTLLAPAIALGAKVKNNSFAVRRFIILSVVFLALLWGNLLVFQPVMQKWHGNRIEARYRAYRAELADKKSETSQRVRGDVALKNAKEIFECPDGLDRIYYNGPVKRLPVDPKNITANHDISAYWYKRFVLVNHKSNRYQKIAEFSYEKARFEKEPLAAEEEEYLAGCKTKEGTGFWDYYRQREQDVADLLADLENSP